MGERIHQTTRRTSGREAVDELVELEPISDETKEREEKRKAETDAMLDEIDEMLEQNAEDFVKGYIQKGGE